MKKFTALTTTIFTFILSAAPVAAQVDISISKPPNLKIDNPGKLLGGVIGLILIISALAAFIFLIWGGVQWITSGGDKAGVEAAQHRIQAALLGLFIVFAAWAIMLVAGQFLGFDISNLKIPTPF
ncbi:hypothetical protein HZB96_02965 [Candidatus Gottesmanbacteria bacterium]|nr:hypothetical protein [Candidatus Gottesmanbacteria bacterium]